MSTHRRAEGEPSSARPGPRPLSRAQRYVGLAQPFALAGVLGAVVFIAMLIAGVLDMPLAVSGGVMVIGFGGARTLRVFARREDQSAHLRPEGEPPAARPAQRLALVGGLGVIGALTMLVVGVRGTPVAVAFWVAVIGIGSFRTLLFFVRRQQRHSARARRPTPRRD